MKSTTSLNRTVTSGQWSAMTCSPPCRRSTIASGRTFSSSAWDRTLARTRSPSMKTTSASAMPQVRIRLTAYRPSPMPSGTGVANSRHSESVSAAHTTSATKTMKVGSAARRPSSSTAPIGVMIGEDDVAVRLLDAAQGHHPGGDGGHADDDDRHHHSADVARQVERRQHDQLRHDLAEAEGQDDRSVRGNGQAPRRRGPPRPGRRPPPRPSACGRAGPGRRLGAGRRPARPTAEPLRSIAALGWPRRSCA